MITAIFSVLSLILLSGCVKADKDVSNPSEHTVSFPAMDTYITFTACGDGAEAAISEAQNRITALEHMWSVTYEGSDIYAVNHAEGQAVEVSDETAELIEYALSMAEQTDGALDPTIYPILTAWGFTTEQNRIPSESEISGLLSFVGYENVQRNGNSVQIDHGMMLDLGAVGKGYAGDIAADILRKNGITSALLNIGGNIQTIGGKPDGADWRLGIKDPTGMGNVGILQVSDLAVVTSGNYERYFTGDDGTKYGHIIDPATGYPVNNGLLSVSIIAKEGKMCDALSTALFVMGLEKACEYWLENSNFDMIVITDNGEIYLSEGISGNFTLDSEHADMKVNVIKK